MISVADVGRVVTLRRRVALGLTDAVGVLEAYADGVLVVRRRDGSRLTVAEADVVAARRVSARLRSATVDDAAAIERLRVRTWRAAYRGLVPDHILDTMPVDAARRRSLLAIRRGDEAVALIGDEIVGWCACGPARDEDQDPQTAGEVYAVYVAPEHWGTGVGQKLLDRAHGWLRRAGYAQVTLWVLSGNSRARHFYEAAGYRPIGPVQTHERVGAPEIRYRCELA
jgi:GNAT superfamily N-acetyltransferase